MAKLIGGLQRQCKVEKYRKSAEDCIVIYKKLLELSDNHIWSSDWRVLVKTRCSGKYLDRQTIYVPSEIGKIFLKGIKHED